MACFQHLGEHSLSSGLGKATVACRKAERCEAGAGRKSCACRCDIQGLRGKFYPFFLLHDVKQQAVNMAFIKITLYIFNSLDNQISATVLGSKVCFYSRPCKTLIPPLCTEDAWSFLIFLESFTSYFSSSKLCSLLKDVLSNWVEAPFSQNVKDKLVAVMGTSKPAFLSTLYTKGTRSCPFVLRQYMEIFS